MADLFWPAATDARDSLSTTLRRLQALGTGTVIIDGDTVAVDISCDALDFTTATSSGRDTEAAALYFGPFLDRIDAPLSEELEEWLYRTRERLADRARRERLRLAKAAHDDGNATIAMRHAEHALDIAFTSGDDVQRLYELAELLRHVGSPPVHATQNAGPAGWASRSRARKTSRTSLARAQRFHTSPRRSSGDAKSSTP